MSIRYTLMLAASARLAGGLPAAGEAPARAAAADTLTLPQVYELARARSPRVAAAAAVADASRAPVPGAGLPPDPSLQVGVMNLGLPSLSANPPSSMSPLIQVTEMRPTPGKLGLSKRMAKDLAAMATSDGSETWWEVRANAAGAYYDVYAPDRQKGRTAVDQAQAGTELARKDIWPDVESGVQYGQRPGQMGTERMGSVLLGFTLPVFAGSRQLQARKEAEAMSRMAQAALTDMRAQVRSRLGEVTADLDRDRNLVALYRSQVPPQAQANVQSALSSYRVRSVDFMTLVDAQMTENQYEQELHAMLGQYGASLAELEMTIGRAVPAAEQLLAEAR